MAQIIDVREPYLPFIPPEREKEPATVRCFINLFPDLSTLLNFPCLNVIPLYKNLIDHIDSVGILTVIISVSLTAIFAIGIFFINIATIEITLFALQSISGSIAVLSAGAYIKRYYLLKRNHKEVKILEKYSKALNDHIFLLQDEILVMNINLDSLSKTSNDLKKENVAFAEQNKELSDRIFQIKSMAEAISLSNTQLTKENLEFSASTLTLKQQLLQQNLENTKLASSNDFLKKTTQTLEQTAIKTQNSYNQLFQEFDTFKNANIVLGQTLALAKEQQKNLDRIVKQGATIEIQTALLKATLENHKKDLKDVQDFIEKEKEELKAVRDQLKDASSKISALVS